MYLPAIARGELAMSMLYSVERELKMIAWIDCQDGRKRIFALRASGQLYAGISPHAQTVRVLFRVFLVRVFPWSRSDLACCK